MIAHHDAYEIDDTFARIDLDRVQSWLATTYWSPGVSRSIVERAARGSSMCIGVYHADQQVGYCRVVSDRATFAWVCDVYVDEAHRSRGIARAMVRFALSHPDHQGFRRWLLATKDAHGVYASLGFEPLNNPERWMTFFPTKPAKKDDCSIS